MPDDSLPTLSLEFRRDAMDLRDIALVAAALDSGLNGIIDQLLGQREMGGYSDAVRSPGSLISFQVIDITHGSFLARLRPIFTKDRAEKAGIAASGQVLGRAIWAFGVLLAQNIDPSATPASQLLSPPPFNSPQYLPELPPNVRDLLQGLPASLGRDFKIVLKVESGSSPGYQISVEQESPLSFFRSIKRRGVDDPDLDLWLAMESGSLPDLKEAILRGANVNVTREDVLGRYGRGGH